MLCNTQSDLQVTVNSLEQDIKQISQQLLLTSLTSVYGSKVSLPRAGKLSQILADMLLQVERPSIYPPRHPQKNTSTTTSSFEKIQDNNASFGKKRP